MRSAVPATSRGRVTTFYFSNALVYNFMSDGIPVVYYGQEQLFAGAADPVSFPPPTSWNYIHTGAQTDEPGTFVALWIPEHAGLPVHCVAQPGMT